MPVANRQEKRIARDRDKKKIVLQISNNSVSFDAQRCARSWRVLPKSGKTPKRICVKKKITPASVGRQIIRNMTEWCRKQC